MVSRIVAKSREIVLEYCFSNGEDAITKLSTKPVDIVLMDISLPKMNGITCVKLLKNLCPDMQFVMYTGSADEDMVFEALKAGALGYLLKDTKPDDLLNALRELYYGGSPMSTSIARKIVSTFHGVPTRISHTPHKPILTIREMELLKLLHEGYRYKEIADKLFISIETVRRHCQNIYKKLQVQSKVEAINKIYPRA
jgi:DNA-binding NarL/FixJ family response regulator